MTKLYFILWKHSDNSGFGVRCAFFDKELAETMCSLFKEDGLLVYWLQEIMVVDSHV